MNVLQEQMTSEEMAAELSEEKTLSVIDLIINGGAASSIIVIVLFVLLFVALNL